MNEPSKKKKILDLSLDIKLDIIHLLDNRSLANLSKTCTHFAMLVRRLLSYQSARLYTLTTRDPPPSLSFRGGALIGTSFYIPQIDEIPRCFIFDLTSQQWRTQPLELIEPLFAQQTSVTSIGNTLFMVGGRLAKSYTLSNSVIEIDVLKWTVTVATVSGTPPRPRYRHSVDVIANRFLVIFGGLCYNSVGENDVFVYDTLNRTWFIPPVQGPVPHLRFGHASAVIGQDLYIHGGAQIDSDSSYIVYDDLHKLDCKTWSWCKYEHPEVEQHLRGQPREEKYNLFPTTGNSPCDRFQSYMCASAGKLIVFGGRSIRTDSSDDEIMYYYSMDELSIFHTKRRSWTMVNACTSSDIVMDRLSVAIVPAESRGTKILIFGQHVHKQTRRLQEIFDGLYKVMKSDENYKQGTFRLIDSEFQEETFYQDHQQVKNQVNLYQDVRNTPCIAVLELLE
ncbi:unnamed protein product [Rhizopus stolonifer]